MQFESTSDDATTLSVLSYVIQCTMCKDIVHTMCEDIVQMSVAFVARK